MGEALGRAGRGGANGVVIADLWAPLMLGGVAGTAVQLHQPQLSPAVAYGLAIVLSAMGLTGLWRWPRARWGWRSAVALLAAALAGFGATGLRALAFDAQRLDPVLEGRDIRVTGTVTAMPQSSEVGLRFRFDVEAAHLVDGPPVRLPPRLQLGWYGGLAFAAEGVQLQRSVPALHAGDRWALTVRLKAPHGNVNPHGFDYELWLWEQGVQATGYVRATARDEAPLQMDSGWSRPVERARQQVRDAILAQVSDRRAAGVVAALVTGDQAAIDRADWDVFRATGVAHLMAISGLHITLFAWLATALVRALWHRSARLCRAVAAPHAAAISGWALAAAYALFSGWGVPAQRTVWMLAVVVLLTLTGRRWPWPMVWLSVLAVVTVVDPWALLQAGFWLSFVAVAVLFATDRGSAPAGLRPRAQALLREQAVVTVALAPLTLLLFGQISLVGLVANLLAIPWVTLLVTPLALAGVLLAPLWDLAAWAVQALGVVLGAMAQWPWATVHLPRAPLWAGFAAVLGGVWMVLRLPWAVRTLGLPLMLPALLWMPPRPVPGHFELLAADVGQGNAVLLRTAGHALVYDAGPRYSLESDAGHRVLVPLLRSMGERVDLLVLSHRDSDHTGGAMALLAQQADAGVLASLEPMHEVFAARPHAQPCEAGHRWSWDGVQFEVLHPQAQDFARAGLKPNALSCVLRVRAASGETALLTGDIEAAQESRLVADLGPALRADWLLVPHHGSRTSSTEGFLDAVAPRWAVVQAGYRNRFGHPAPAVMDRYVARGIPVVSSSDCGAATWRSEQGGIIRCERQAQRRYWRHR